MERRFGIAATVLIIGLLLSSSGVTWAVEERGEYGGHDGKRGHGMGAALYGMGGHFSSTGHYLPHLLRHQDEIGLSDDQVNKLKAIQLDLDKTRIRTEAEILVAERELAALTEDDKTDLPAIEAKLKQSEGLGTALRMAAIKAKREAVGLLNPDQRKKEKIEHEKMMHGHMGRSGMTDGGTGRHGEQKGDQKPAR
jgi:protein CpxP